MSQSRFTPETTRLDDAARAGWLYYVAGNTQDEIAKKLGVSRQSAQRLVSLAVSEKLVKVRLDHPIARCMDLSGALAQRFKLKVIEVVPTDPTAPELLTGIAIAAAAEMEKLLKSPEEKIIALGTGRALRACVEQLPRMDCPQHRIVSRLGNMMSDGSATPYNAVIRMAERVGAKHYPFPLPVVARDEEELRVMHGQEPVRHTMQLCARADFTLVGVGQIGMNAPLHVDGFMQAHEMNTLVAQGAAGEITSWVYDTEGRVMDCAFNMRVASAPLTVGGDAPVVGLAAGPDKAGAIRAALRGGLINGLITDEATAERLLKQ
ncbi:sugar-binding transcriptional regulator [Limimaricola cinnabarinus]|uniref:Transcriptional regulator of mannitol utilization, DeoR family protein n=1 Tax=Limimaricola cinnabarinus LL-001 TaxID=1337093 RepID=U2YQC0_9RHOB|nr:sugar-binding transcriptional regulator [Limimaricola cinnabarinus]GAD57626.1 transcriptional regulator of mannitol utilization, DeoR family protein [Limimaricola cinnabarinus LL-001]